MAKYERPTVEDRKVVTREYIYSVRVGRDVEGEVFAWHWHPGREETSHPHVHVRAEHEDLPKLRDSHIPTGRVFLEDILLFAIRNLDVTCRDGGEDRLEELRRRTGRYVSWM